MAFTGGGSVQVVLCRFTLLGPTGAPVVGPTNCYVFDGLIGVQLTPNYNKQTTISQLDGQGRVCLTFSPPQTFQYLQIDSFQLCQPNPEVLEFVNGGAVLQDTGTGNAIGYAFPYIGSNPKPNGVGIEFWSLSVTGGSVNGYFHWLCPRAYMIFAKGLKLDGKDSSVVEIEGNGTENPNWLKGPKRDWNYTISDRALMWVYEQALPNYTPGYSAVLAAS